MVKIAVVTGGSRGIGRATVLALAKKGVNSIFTYNSSPEKAEEVVKEVVSLGAAAQTLRLDVNKPETIEAFVGELKNALAVWRVEKFDYLINNAGISITSTLMDLTEDQFDSLFNIHVKSVFFLTKRTLGIINDGGHVITISSNLTRVCNPGYIGYASAKAAIEVFTRYLAKEQGPRGIRANTISPGVTETDIGGGQARDDQAINKYLSGLVALERLGKPEEIGSAIAAILSDDARWINAQTIEVSGGQQL